MSPPYKFIDEATGEVIWSGIDAKPGQKIEIFADGHQRIVPSALIRPGGTTPPVDPPVDPIPPVEPPVVTPPANLADIPTMSLFKPTTTAQLQAIANDCAANRYVAMLAPGTKITLTDTIVFKQNQHDGSVWGIDFNWAQLSWAGPAGGDMLRCEGVTGAANRAFVCTNVQLYGGGWWEDRGRAHQAGACLKINCPGGDPMAYYKPTLQNIYCSYAEYGFVFTGAVFEFSHINLHAENMTKDGMLAQSAGGAVLSNVFGIAPNMSRNGGSGINTGYSHNIIMGSFIQNSQYAINAPQGLRVAAFNNGENTGESLIKLGHKGYGSVIFANEMSTGAVGVNNENAPSTGHSKYILDAPAGNPALPDNTNEMENHVASYGPGDALDKRVRK